MTAINIINSLVDISDIQIFQNSLKLMFRLSRHCPG